MGKLGSSNKLTEEALEKAAESTSAGRDEEKAEEAIKRDRKRQCRGVQSSKDKGLEQR